MRAEADRNILDRLRSGPGMNFHFITAAEALSARMGLPPTTSTLLTFPSAATVTFRRTRPPICACFNSSEYSGFTETSTLRSDLVAFCASEKVASPLTKQSVRIADAIFLLAVPLVRETKWLSKTDLAKSADRLDAKQVKARSRETRRQDYQRTLNSLATWEHRGK